MKTWTVQVRLYVGFGLILSFLIIPAGIGLWNVNETNRRFDDIVEVNVQKMHLLQTMSRSVLSVSDVVRTVALEGNPAVTAAELPKIMIERNRYDGAFAKLQKFPPNAEAAPIRERMKSSAAEASLINDEIINLIVSDGDKDRIKKLIYDAIGPSTRWLQAIDDNIHLQKKQDAKDRAEASAAASSALRLFALTMLLGSVTSVGFAWLIKRTLGKELGGEPAHASSIAKAIPSGNLAAPITVDCPDSLQDAMLKMRENLAELVVQVRAGAEQISARKIADIIAVIDGIAFQANIRDLNVAAEAARAGEQERGFAVGAAEVRHLAQRSAAAAKEIQALIGDSVEKVDSGSVLADQAGATMKEVASSARRVTDIIGEITRASAEQKSGIEQVNTAIVQIDDVTRQNAALLAEAAAAVQAMRGQAAQLEQLASALSANRSIMRPPTSRKPSLWLC